MSSEEVPSRDSQLDRVEGKLDQLIDRLSRAEERAHTQAGKIAANEVRLDDHATRIRDVEVAHAVSAALTKQSGQQLQGRWAALGATALVILGGIGAFVGNTIVRVFNIGGGG